MLRAMAPELTEAQRAAVVAAFRRCYDSCDLAKTTAREGVRDLLHALHDAGAILFVATNKPHLPARRVLTKTGILPLITDCIAPDAMPGARASKSEMISHLIDKWGMRKGSTCVVGDAATDVQAAHDNGLASVAVLSGYGDAEEIRRSRPTFTAESMRDVQAVLCPGKCANSHGAAETSSAPVVES
jgi:phosphoglycolate phosphatase